MEPCSAGRNNSAVPSSRDRIRTALFVPASRPDRIAKAVGCGADAVVVDLEDAVAVDAKAVARGQAVDAVNSLADDPGGPGHSTALAVRVNAVGSRWVADDLQALAALLPRLWAVVLPMTTAGDEVRWLDDALTRLETAAGVPPGRTRILPIVETAAGVLGAAVIAGSSARVATLLFGPADLSAELGVTATPDGDELLHARSQLVLAAAAARRARPLDGPHLNLDDPDGLARSAASARRLGFGGKVVIHPGQVGPVTAAFVPAEHEVAWARAVDDAFAEAERAGNASIRLHDGTFVDYPVASRARAILADWTDVAERTP